MSTLVRWSPFQELDTFERRMRRMLDELGLVPAALPAEEIFGWTTFLRSVRIAPRLGRRLGWGSRRLLWWRRLLRSPSQW